MSLIKLHENTDENILDIIHRLYENVEKSKTAPEYQHIWINQIPLYQNELQRRYIQRSFEATKDALESSEKYNKSAQKAMWISIGISVFALIISVIIGIFSITSSSQWQKEQLPVLESINSNTKKNIESFEKFKTTQNKHLLILKSIKELQERGLKNEHK